jgi:hypothetical protein
VNLETRLKLTSYLEQDTYLRDIFEYTKIRFNSRTDLTAHNWEHARRDVLNGIVIGEAEAADMSVVLPALVMHDIGFLYGATGKTHGEVGASRLREYLNDSGIHGDEDRISQIRECIRTHTGSMHGIEPVSLEAKVVSDADFIEKFGPVGIYQIIRTYGEFNYSASRIMKNLSDTAGYKLTTQTGERWKLELIGANISFAAAFAAAYEPYGEEDEAL